MPSVYAERVMQLIDEAAGLVKLAHAQLHSTGRFEHRGPCFLNVTVDLFEQEPVRYRVPLDGDPATWEVPFDQISDSKHDISNRTNEDTVDVPLIDRQPGDTQYWGSIVLLFDGGSIVVAISGLQPWFDEGLSRAIAGYLLALLKNEQLVPCGFEPDRNQPHFLTAEYLEELQETTA